MGLDTADVPPRYRSSYFLHIWANGYAAGYYAYLWTQMLDDDAYSWFEKHGGMTRANGQRFRDMILSKGHSEDYGPMFRAFYGKDPDIGPMLEDRGLAGPPIDGWRLHHGSEKAAAPLHRGRCGGLSPIKDLGGGTQVRA